MNNWPWIYLPFVIKGGQFVLELVDHHGATFVVFFLAIVELMAFCWIYGVKRLCDDVYFMLGYRPNIIWRICWQFVTPLVMIVIFIYSLISLKPVTYNGYVYKDSHYGKSRPFKSMKLTSLHQIIVSQRSDGASQLWALANSQFGRQFPFWNNRRIKTSSNVSWQLSNLYPIGDQPIQYYCESTRNSLQQLIKI